MKTKKKQALTQPSTHQWPRIKAPQQLPSAARSLTEVLAGTYSYMVVSPEHSSGPAKRPSGLILGRSRPHGLNFASLPTIHEKQA